MGASVLYGHIFTMDITSSYLIFIGADVQGSLNFLGEGYITNGRMDLEETFGILDGC